MKKSPEQYKELSYTLHPDSKIVNILSQFGHVLSLFTILSLNLWRARCRHNIPSSLNIALCVSQTTVTLLHLHAILPNTNPHPLHRPRSNQLSQYRTFPLAAQDLLQYASSVPSKLEQFLRFTCLLSLQQFERYGWALYCLR